MREVVASEILGVKTYPDYFDKYSMKHLFLLVVVSCAFNSGNHLRHPSSYVYERRDPLLESLASIATKDFSPKLIETFPEELTSNSIKYVFEPEQVLKPKQCAYLSVPEELRSKYVQTIILGHRANPEGNRGVDPQTKYDNLPALTTVQLNLTSDDGKPHWRYWDGSASGQYGAKFAEPGWDLERENLYEWYKNGHSDVVTGISSYEPFATNAMRVCSIGDDPVNLGTIELRVFPGHAKTYMEKNFGVGNRMGDPLTAKGRYNGELNGAITLNGSNTGIVPEEWTYRYSSLEIPLEAGRTFKTFDIAVSDTHASTISGHDDNQHTTAGWAEIKVYIQKIDGTQISVMDWENVPPRGVLNGAPSQDALLEEGDKLVIKGRSDRLHILGLKIGLD